MDGRLRIETVADTLEEAKVAPAEKKRVLPAGEAGTTVDGERVELRRCGLRAYDGNEVARKDSFFKIVEP